jgi:hypothetical protein
MPDADTLAAADLTDALRAWLRARPEPPAVVAAALTFELAALLARYAESVPQAYALLDVQIETLKAQIAVFGVGREHP